MNKTMLEKKFINDLFETHSNKTNLPSPFLVIKLIDTLLSVLFPAYSNKVFSSKEEFDKEFFSSKQQLFDTLLFAKSFMDKEVETIVNEFYNELPILYKMLLKDAEAIDAGDPAAKNTDEVMHTYPGFYAISIYRIAHLLHQLKVPFIPRILTEIAHSRTGIDIHPAATIGSHFSIDHGTGVVIGETTNIGNFVKLYQGVTLGALSVTKELAQTKRHPTIEDHVVIYAGASILGGKTVIGKNSVIGGNVWLTESVGANKVVYHTYLNVEKLK